MPLNIDWQQILLHMFNVAILFFVLYFLLYSPVKKFIAKRQEHFESEEKKSEDAKKLADETRLEYENKLSEIHIEAEAEKEAMLKDAEEECAKQIASAKDRADKIVEDAKAKAKDEHDKIIENAKGEIALLATSMAEKIILKDTGDSYDKFLSSSEGETKDE